MQERPIGEHLDGTRGRVKIDKSLRTRKVNVLSMAVVGHKVDPGMRALLRFDLYQNAPSVKPKITRSKL